MINAFKYILLDNLRNRFIIGYLILMIFASLGLLYLSNDVDKGVLGISNIILLVVPLVTSIYTCISVYNAADFTRLLLTQPISRSQISMAYLMSLILSQVIVFVIGTGVPLIVFSGGEKVAILMLSGTMLTIIFTALSFMLSLQINDKVKGMGTVLFLWLYFSLIYDGILLLFVRAMVDYPIEQYSLFFTILNPVDLCRILIMFSMDISVLMGLTGAVLQEYMGTTIGLMLIIVSLILWAFVPAYFAIRIFNRKDF